MRTVAKATQLMCVTRAERSIGGYLLGPTHRLNVCRMADMIIISTYVWRYADCGAPNSDLSLENRLF